MATISWPRGVNRIVTNETNGNVGENGVESDKSDNGSEMTRLKGSGVPDRYTVSMYFSNSKDDVFYQTHTDAYGNHLTEWQAWLSWFKYVCMDGVNPFHFHDIGDNTEGRSAVYKISSSGLPNWTPHGEYMQVRMTWVEVFRDHIIVETPEPEGDYLDICPGMIEMMLTEQPDSPPLKSEFYDGQGASLCSYSADGATFKPLSIERVDWDGFKSVVLYYDAALTADRLSGGNAYTIRVRWRGSELEENFIGGAL